MPTPTSTDPLGYGTRNSCSDEWPMIYIKLPYVLVYVLEVFEQVRRLILTVDSCQRAKRAVCVHADPFLLRHILSLFQNFSMTFQFPSIKASKAGNQPRHKTGQKDPSH